MSMTDDDPAAQNDPHAPPLPRADRRDLLDPQAGFVANFVN